jgi:hypothetical protein
MATLYHDEDPERPSSSQSEDEKTVHGIQLENTQLGKKVEEDGIRSGGDAQPLEQAVVSQVDEDDFPEGGRRAWLVVFGVRTLPFGSSIKVVWHL